MPLREGLLEPIPGENPSGANLKYDRVYDQIKEARTEEDDTLPAGQWARQTKRADSVLVQKLAGEALAARSKDLQLAVWLGEAQLRREGAVSLEPVLSLLLALQQQFWETVYPEIDEGDTGFRAVPLQWAANRYAALVYRFPLTKSGIDYFQYKAGRAIGYEADADESETRREARKEAVGNGQLTAEDVDAAVQKSPKTFYAELDAQLRGSQDMLETMALYCEEQYGEDGPSFRKLRDSLEEVGNVVHSLLSEKRREEPDAETDREAEPEETELYEAEPEGAVPDVAEEVPEAPRAVPRRAATRGTQSTVVASREDALERVQAAAAFLFIESRNSVVPYLLHTAVRWGELRDAGPDPLQEMLVAPPTAVRTGLKQAAIAGEYDELLGRCIAALGEPCCRVWLDIHRYIWTAARELGLESLLVAVSTALAELLREYPQLPEWTFDDDTPVANGDTLRWLREEILPREATEEAAGAEVSREVERPVVFDFSESHATASAETGPQEHDAFDEARALAEGGSLHAAITLLTHDARQQTSGRMRYQRRMQIAELCLADGNPRVALPILRELIGEVEQRNLESWENGELIARPLALLLRVQDDSLEAAEREAMYARLCRIDPTAALAVSL